MWHPTQGKGPANIRQRKLKGTSVGVAVATPWIQARGTFAAYVGAANTSNTVNLPAPPDGGAWPVNTLAIVVGVKGPATFAIGAGWTTLLSPSTSSFLAYKYLNGTETTFPYTRGATFSADILHCIILGGTVSGQAPEAVQATNDPPIITPSWGAGATTAFLTVATGAAAGTNITTYPSAVTDQPYSFFSTLGDSIGQSLSYADAQIYYEMSEIGVTTTTYNPSTFAAANSLQTYTIAVRRIAPPVAQSLVLAPGSFNLTGTAETTSAGRKLIGAAGSFVLTGSAANLILGTKLVASPGAFNLTGTAANFALARKLVLASGTYNLSGSAATTFAGRKLILASGTFNLTGSAATTSAGRKLPLAAGSFSLTGSTAGQVLGRKLALAPGSFSLSGSAATMKVARLFPATAGTFTLSGSAANLKVGRVLSLVPGAFTLNGSVATLTFTPGAGAVNYTLALAAGSFSVTGSARSLPVGRKLVLAPGVFSLTGLNATLTWGRKLVLTAGSYALSGTNTGSLLARKLTLAPGAFSFSGLAATLVSTVPQVPKGGLEYGEEKKKKRVIPHPDQFKASEPQKQETRRVQKKAQQKAAVSILRSEPVVAPLSEMILPGTVRSITSELLDAWFEGNLKAEIRAEEQLVELAERSLEEFLKGESLAQEKLMNLAAQGELLNEARLKEEEFLIQLAWSTFFES